MMAPDEKTFAYVAGRPYAPKGEDWERALAYWRTLPTDRGAVFDKEVVIDGGKIAPMVTWGTSPENALPVTGQVPDPGKESDGARRAAMERALDRSEEHTSERQSLMRIPYAVFYLKK